MFIILSIVSIVIALALTLAVLVQNSKGGGLNSTFGGAAAASQLLGSRRSTDLVEKLTWYLAGALVIVSFLATISISSGTAPTGLQQVRPDVEAFQPDNISTPELTTPAVEGATEETQE